MPNTHDPLLSVDPGRRVKWERIDVTFYIPVLAHHVESFCLQFLHLVGAHVGEFQPRRHVAGSPASLPGSTAPPVH